MEILPARRIFRDLGNIVICCDIVPFMVEGHVMISIYFRRLKWLVNLN